MSLVLYSLVHTPELREIVEKQSSSKLHLETLFKMCIDVPELFRTCAIRYWRGRILKRSAFQRGQSAHPSANKKHKTNLESTHAIQQPAELSWFQSSRALTACRRCCTYSHPRLQASCFQDTCVWAVCCKQKCRRWVTRSHVLWIEVTRNKKTPAVYKCLSAKFRVWFTQVRENLGVLKEKEKRGKDS